MSLTSRLTAFFLGALALVLIGFSIALYLVARETLSRQIDDRLEAALHALTAAVEMDRGALEWEPFQRKLSLGDETDADEVRWTVRDERGVLVDRARNVGSESFLADLPSIREVKRPRFVRFKADGRSWRVAQTRLDSSRPRDKRDSPRHHASLILTAAIRLDPAEAALGNLSRLSAGLSLGVWLLSAALGRRFCRKALRPLSTMAETARGMTIAEIGHRLPSAGTSDELQELSDAFNGLLDRLGEAFERQQRFTGDASHQLRTPLAVMLGQIDVALRRDRTADDYKHTLTLVRDHAGRLSKIVEMLLFLARADAEASLPGRQVIDLGEWARNQEVRRAEHPRSARFEVVLQGEGPRLALVHPPLLDQLVDNLLENAWKYTDAPTTVRLVVGRQDGRVTIAVEDEGGGIDPADLPHVFEPFYRSTEARRLGRSGVGLGLSVSKRIARAFEGRLTVESTLGRGSEFRLSLPDASQHGTGDMPVPEDLLPRRPESVVAGS
jgi:heavy metal sensor kinase